MNEKHSGDNPPPKIPTWDHSEQVLVYYEANPEVGITDKWGIAYYHYNPPFESARWIDFDNVDRTPKYWFKLPKL